MSWFSLFCATTKDMQYDRFKEGFEKELTQINAGRAYIISIIGFSSGAFLLFIDWLRYRGGYFAANEAYYVLTVCHVLLFAMIVPAWIIKKNRKAIDQHLFPSINRWTTICIWITWLALIPMALAGILDRGSIMPFGIYVFIANLFFVLPMKQRLYINLSAFTLLMLGVFYMDLLKITKTIYLVEALGFIVPTFLIANNQYRLMNDTFANKRLLEEKNESMQAANVDLMMQALQAQMNPHFIFNTLNSIQHFLVANDQQSSLMYMSRFARLIRLIFQYSKERWIKLEDEIEFLQLYLQLEELRFENKVKTTFEVDSQLEERANDWMVPPLLIQPLIENAFKHGLMHVEEGGQLSIAFQQKISCLICTIEDNGVGREKAKAYDVWRKEEHRSSALEIIRQRLETFNKFNEGKTDDEKSNDLTLTDLLDADGKPCGTRIELSICLETQKILYERSLQTIQTLYDF